MRMKVVRRGGEVIVVLPKEIVDTLPDNAEVDVRTIADDEPTLDELLDRITEENLHDYVDWGPPVGNEW